MASTSTEIEYGKWGLLNPAISRSLYLLEFGKNTGVMFEHIQPPIKSQSRFCLTVYHRTDGIVLFYPKSGNLALIGNTSYITSSLGQIGEAPGLPQNLREGLELLLRSLR